MKIEAGKYYKMRNGKKAYVSAVTLSSPFTGKPPEGYPVSGFMEGESRVVTWTSSGAAIVSATKCATDLVAEWREPATFMPLVTVVRFCSGSTLAVIGEPTPGLGPHVVISRKHVVMHEGEGLNNILEF